MTIHSRSEVSSIIKRLTGSLDDSSAIVLIGSVARNCPTQRSDIDILLVGEGPVIGLRAPNFEFHTLPVKKFLDRLACGDDFPNWCVRFGIPLAGKQHWETVLYRAERANWPDWKKKITISVRRLLACRLSLQTGDRKAAAESALFAYDHLIRGILLREMIFPLSRPELARQVKPLNPALGKGLSILLHNSIQTLDLRHLLRNLMAALKEIDSDLYAEPNDQLHKIVYRTQITQATIRKQVS